MEISYEQLQGYLEKLRYLESDIFNNNAYKFVDCFVVYLTNLLSFYQKSNVIFQLQEILIKFNIHQKLFDILKKKTQNRSLRGILCNIVSFIYFLQLKNKKIQKICLSIFQKLINYFPDKNKFIEMKKDILNLNTHNFSLFIKQFLKINLKTKEQVKGSCQSEVQEKYTKVVQTNIMKMKIMQRMIKDENYDLNFERQKEFANIIKY